MGNLLIEKQFARIGARVKLNTLASESERHWLTVGPPTSVSVQTDGKGEYFDLMVDLRQVNVEVIDVQEKVRHLLLLARSVDGSRKDKFVCGHGERWLFVAAIPDVAGVSGVRTALEALKPPEVLAAQRRVALRPDRRQTRRNAAFVRQGEWFFVPAPEFEPKREVIYRNEPLRRGGGKSHKAQELVRVRGVAVYWAARFPKGVTEEQRREYEVNNPNEKIRWSPMRRYPDIYVRGRVSHADHKTIVLPNWHRAHLNMEGQSRAVAHGVFLD